MRESKDLPETEPLSSAAEREEGLLVEISPPLSPRAWIEKFTESSRGVAAASPYLPPCTKGEKSKVRVRYGGEVVAGVTDTPTPV